AWRQARFACMTTTLEHLPDPYQVAREAADAIAEASGAPTHDLALVLGSGWAGAADLLGRTVWEADATTIPGFRPPAVAGHAGVLRSIEVEGSGARVLVLGARTHLYEGAGVDPVVHGVRTAAAAGCGTMVLTNGGGGVDPARPPGTPVLISDQINHTGATPLAEANFVQLTYLRSCGASAGASAEVRMARITGACLIRMSAALEAIAAGEAGMAIRGVSRVTTLAAGTSPAPLRHEEGLRAGKDAGPRIPRGLA